MSCASNCRCSALGPRVRPVHELILARISSRCRRSQLIVTWALPSPAFRGMVLGRKETNGIGAEIHTIVEELGVGDVAEVGGKNASLGELYRELTPMGVNVPNGFAITASAYRDTLDAAGVWERLATLMGGVDKADVGDLAVRARMRT